MPTWAMIAVIAGWIVGWSVIGRLEDDDARRLTSPSERISDSSSWTLGKVVRKPMFPHSAHLPGGAQDSAEKGQNDRAKMIERREKSWRTRNST